MKPPIVICEGLDIKAYSTVAEAESSLEAFDVKNNIYLMFDSEGRKLKADTYKTLRKGRLSFLFGEYEVELVKIVSGEDHPTHQQLLFDIVMQYFIAIAQPISESSDGLEELVQRLIKCQNQG